MDISVQVPGGEAETWRRRLWLVGYVIGFGLLFTQALAALVNQITPPLPAFDSATYAFPASEETCIEEGGTWIPYGGDQPAFTPDVNGTCQGPLQSEIERDEKQNRYADVRSLVFGIGGGVALVLGLLAWKARGLAAGLVVGGILALYALSQNFSTFLSNSGVTGRNAALALGVVLLVAAYVGWRAFESKQLGS